MSPCGPRGSRRAAMQLVAVLAIAASAAALPGVAGAQDQSPVPLPSGGVIGTGDPRSEGEGPGLVGSPVEVALGVVVIGVLAAGATALVLRLGRDD